MARPPQQPSSVRSAQSRPLADGSELTPTRDWTGWRPRRSVALLCLSLFLLLAWIGFLLLLIGRR